MDKSPSREALRTATPHGELMDYMATLPGARVIDAANEARTAMGLTTPEAVKSTMARYSDAMERLSKL